MWGRESLALRHLPWASRKLGGRCRPRYLPRRRGCRRAWRGSCRASLGGRSRVICGTMLGHLCLYSCSSREIAYSHSFIPSSISHVAFSGFFSPKTFNPSLTPYGGSHTMPSQVLLRLMGVFVKSAEKKPPSWGLSPYWAKFPGKLFFLLPSPRMLRPSMSLPQPMAPKWAQAMGKDPVPTKGS